MAIGSSNPTNNITKIAGNLVSVNGGIKDYGTQRVVLATDQTAIPITDNGSSLTVDGVVELGATSLSALENITVVSSGTVTATLAAETTKVIGTVNHSGLTDTQLRASAVPVSLASIPTHAVTGTFWQATQPISAVSLPLPSGAGTAANQSTIISHVDGIETLLTSIEGDTTAIQTSVQLLDDTVISDGVAIGTTKMIAVGGTDGTNSQIMSTNASGHINIADGGNSITVDGIVAATQSGVWNITNLSQLNGNAISMNTGVRDAGTQRVTIATNDVVPVSVSSIPSHPVTNAGTFAVQVTSAPTTAVTGPLTDTQLRASALSVSGTVTANLGTVSGLALDATLTGGTQKSITRGGAKGTTAAADITSTSVDANTQALDVSIKGTVPVSGTFYQATQPVSLTSVPSHPVTNTGTFAVQVSSMPTTAVTGTFWQATQPVSIASMPSTAVTNVGTFAVQATQSGTWNIGSITTLPALSSGTNTIGKLASNSNVVIGSTEASPSINNALTNVSTTAYAASLVIRASAGKVYNIVGFNSSTSGQFIQIHNTSTVPVNGAVPIVIFYVGPLSNFSLDYGVYGKSFSSGITICNSSTGPTKTIGAADCWFSAEII